MVNVDWRIRDIIKFQRPAYIHTVFAIANRESLHIWNEKHEKDRKNLIKDYHM